MGRGVFGGGSGGKIERECVGISRGGEEVVGVIYDPGFMLSPQGRRMWVL